VQVTSKEDSAAIASNYKPAAPAINISSITTNFSTNDKKIGCMSCYWMNDFGMDYCEKCGESLNDPSNYSDAGLVSVGFIENYYGGGTGDGANFMS